MLIGAFLHLKKLPSIVVTIACPLSGPVGLTISRIRAATYPRRCSRPCRSGRPCSHAYHLPGRRGAVAHFIIFQDELRHSIRRGRKSQGHPAIRAFPSDPADRRIRSGRLFGFSAVWPGGITTSSDANMAATTPSSPWQRHPRRRVFAGGKVSAVGAVVGAVHHDAGEHAADLSADLARLADSERKASSSSACSS